MVHVHFGSVAALDSDQQSAAGGGHPLWAMTWTVAGCPAWREPLRRGLFPIAAFFAAGIICTDESVREHLWWRTAEARVVPCTATPGPMPSPCSICAAGYHRSTELDAVARSTTDAGRSVRSHFVPMWG